MERLPLLSQNHGILDLCGKYRARVGPIHLDPGCQDDVCPDGVKVIKYRGFLMILETDDDTFWLPRHPRHRGQPK